jgi:hypothetical protein
MSSSIDALKLYSFDGRARNSMPEIDPNKPFSIPATQFTPGFEVNNPSQDGDLAKLLDNKFGVNGNGQLGQVPQNSQSSFNDLMSFGQKTFSTSGSLSYEGVTGAYRDMMAAQGIGGQSLSQLLQQDSFIINNGSMGLKVQTDGNGNIDSVSLVQPGLNKNDLKTLNNPLLENRSDIIARASSVEANDLGPSNPNNLNLNNPQSTQIQSPDNNPFLAAGKEPTQAIQSQSKLTFGAEAQTLGVNTKPDNTKLGQLLQQLQPKEVDTQIFGPDSNLSHQDAQQLGAVNAGYGVNYSESFNENMSKLRAGLALQEANRSMPDRIAQARIASMPVAPFVPSEGANSVRQGHFGSQSNNLQQASTFIDTAEKKSSGGYIPFRQNSGGGQQQQQQQRRKPLSAMA